MPASNLLESVALPILERPARLLRLYETRVLDYRPYEGRPIKLKWRKYTHFNGAPIYYCPRARLLTTDGIEQMHIHQAVVTLHDEVLEDVRASNLWRHIPADWEMFIDGTEDFEGGGFCHFTSISEERFVSFPADGGAFIKSKDQFWRSIETTPMHLKSLPPNAEKNFLSALAFGASERVLDHKEATFPYDDGQIKQILFIYQTLKEHQRQAGDQGWRLVPALAWHIARVMGDIEGRRSALNHGTRGAIVHRIKSEPTRTRTLQWIDIVLAFIAFGAHESYRKRLEDVRWGESVQLLKYRALVRQLLLEWADFNLLATVFVTSNVAFLAVPNISELQKDASLVSTVFALLSIVSGVHHVWHHRGVVDADYDDAGHYLWHTKALGEEYDMTVTACFLSLPIASLLWSVGAFTIALSAMCFQNAGIKDQAILSAVFVSCGILMTALTAFFWHVWAPPVRDSSPDSGSSANLRWQLMTFCRDVINRLRAAAGLGSVYRADSHARAGATDSIVMDKVHRAA